MATDLEVSSSPRSTWVWARNDAQAAQLLAILLAADCSVEPARGRNAESRVLDIDIGYEALGAFNVLAGAGYSFRWHPRQHELNRHSTFLGHEVVDPRHVEWQREADEEETARERSGYLEADERFNADWDADPEGDVPGSHGMPRASTS